MKNTIEPAAHESWDGRGLLPDSFRPAPAPQNPLHRGVHL